MFKQRQHKTFRYRSPFQDVKNQEPNEDITTKLQAIRTTSKRRGFTISSLPILLILLGGLFVFLYILEGYIK